MLFRSAVNEETGKFTVPEGGVKVKGLAEGSYVLTEVETPPGYIKTIQNVEFSVDKVGGITDQNNTLNEGKVTYLDKQYKIQNEPGKELPNTGGSGTNIFYLLGIMLISIAGTGLLMRKYRKAA